MSEPVPPCVLSVSLSFYVPTDFILLFDTAIVYCIFAFFVIIFLRILQYLNNVVCYRIIDVLSEGMWISFFVCKTFFIPCVIQLFCLSYLRIKWKNSVGNV